MEHQVPLGEENFPVAVTRADKKKCAGAGVGHVSSDVEKIFEKPEGGEGEAVGLPVEKEIQAAEERDEKFAECSAEDHKGVAAPTEEEMACFVDHEINEIGKEKAGGVAEGVEEKERISEEPGDAGVA